MAASTLYTLLLKLGFDVSELKTGGPAAQRELDAVGASADRVAKMAAPAAKALENLTAAASNVQGTVGAASSLNLLAKSMAAISTATGGSQTAMNAFARAAAQIAAATSSAPALNAFSKAITEIANTAGTGAPRLISFAKAAGDLSVATSSPNASQLIAFAKAEALMTKEAADKAKLEALAKATDDAASAASGGTARLESLSNQMNTTSGAAAELTSQLKNVRSELSGVGAGGGGSQLPRNPLDGMREAMSGQEGQILGGLNEFLAQMDDDMQRASSSGELPVGALVDLQNQLFALGDAGKIASGDMAILDRALDALGQGGGGMGELRSLLEGIASGAGDTDAMLDQLAEGLGVVRAGALTTSEGLAKLKADLASMMELWGDHPTVGPALNRGLAALEAGKLPTAQLDNLRQIMAGIAAQGVPTAQAMEALEGVLNGMGPAADSADTPLVTLARYVDTLTGKSEQATKIIATLKAELLALSIGAGKANFNTLFDLGAKLSNLTATRGSAQVGANDLKGIQNYLTELYRVPSAAETAAKTEAEAAAEAMNLASASQNAANGVAATGRAAAGAVSGIQAEAKAASDLAAQLAAAARATGSVSGSASRPGPRGPNLNQPMFGGGMAGGGGTGGGGGGGPGGGGGGGGGTGPGGAAAAGFNAVPPAAARASASVMSFADKVDVAANRASFLNRTLSMAFAFSGGVAVTNAIGFISNALIGFNSRLEQAHIAFTTLLGDSGAADMFIDKMKRFADVTPFDFQGMVEATQRLLAMGFTAEQVIPTLKVVGDAVAGLGGSPEKLDRITIALGQMSTAGRVNAQDMRQLTEAGIPAWQMLADAIGKSVQETRDMAEKGTIPASQAIAALLSGMDARFSGLMSKQARTAAGAFTTIRDSALDVISGAVKPLYDAISGTMVLLADFFLNGGGRMIVPAIQAIGVAIAIFLIPRLLGVVQSAYMASVSLGGLALPILPLVIALTALGFALQENIGGLRDALGPAISALADFAKAALEAAVRSGVLIPILEGLAIVITTKVVLSMAIYVISVAAATLATTAFGTALTAATFGLVLLAAPIALTAGAVGLLIINFDRVIQVLRLVLWAFTNVGGHIFEIASKIPFVGDAFKGLSESLLKSADDMRTNILRIDQELKDKDLAKSAADAAKTPDDLFANWKDQLKGLVSSFTDAATSVGDATEMIKDKTKYNLAGIGEIAKTAGADSMSQLAQGILQARNEPLDALVSLHNLMKTQMSEQGEINRLYGMLMNAELAAGLESSDPVVRSQAIATQKLITERLDALTNGAFSAGQNTGVNLGNGLKSSKSIEAIRQGMAAGLVPLANALRGAAPVFSTDILTAYTSLSSDSVQALANTWNTDYLPAATDAANATQAITNYLNDLDHANDAATSSTQALSDALRSQAADAAYELGQAFSDIKDKAHDVFQTLHDSNMKAIADSRDAANQILSDKQKAIQGTVDAFQAQIDAERAMRKESELRDAVTNAKNPAEQAKAQQDLIDFLQDQDAKAQQITATGDIAALQAQIDANNAKADADNAAENARFAAQQAAFDKEFGALQAFLDRHPEAWSQMNASILALLDKYGVDYKTAGQTIGDAFAQGLMDSVANVTNAAKTVFDTANAIAAASNAKGAGTPTLPSFEPGQVGKGGTGGGSSTGPSSPLSGTAGVPVGVGAGAAGGKGTGTGNVEATGSLGGAASASASLGGGAANKGQYVKSSLDAFGVGRLFLQAIGAPTTPENVKAVGTWLAAENSHPTLRNNPWNLHSWGGLPGQIGYDYVNGDDQNVAIFRTIEDGVRANANNLSHLRNRYPKYGDAIRSLMDSDPMGFLNNIARSPWSASGYGLRHKVKGADGKMHWEDNPNGSNHLIGMYNSYASGAWRLAADQMAMVHAGEMIVPKFVADSLRSLLAGSTGEGEWQNVGSSEASRSGSLGGTGFQGGGTIIFKVGEHEFVRWTDERLAVRRSVAGVED